MRRMYDSDRPSAIPTDAQMVAGYIDGTTGKWTAADWRRFPNSIHVEIARRDTTNAGHVLDVEPGFPTWPPSIKTVRWVEMRRTAGMIPTIYCNEVNGWPILRKLFYDARVPEPQWWTSRYKLSLADSIPAGAVARQWADPVLHGQGHFDLSTVADYWPGVDRSNTMTSPWAETFQVNAIEDGHEVKKPSTYGNALASVYGMVFYDGIYGPSILKRLDAIDDIIESITVGAVDYNLLATKLADELDRRARDHNPETGPTS